MYAATLPSASIFLTRKQDRRQDALIDNFRSHIRRLVSAGSCLEIGASLDPILPKADGFNVTVVDHLDADGLRAKYRADGLDVSRIETVDHVWTSGRLSDLIPKRFHAVVAAHVIEHMPDLVAFLDDCERMLEDGGRLVLLIPDKRYAFDYFQPVSDAAKVLGDHLRGAERHTFEALYRQSAAAAMKFQGSHRIAWGQGRVSELHLMDGDPDKHLAKAKAEASSAAYVDSHEYYFTPSIFMAIIGELSYLGFTHFAFETLTRSRGCEFLAILRKAPVSPRPNLAAFLESKKALLLNHLREEIEEANRQLRVGRPGIGPLGVDSVIGRLRSAVHSLVRRR